MRKWFGRLFCRHDYETKPIRRAYVADGVGQLHKVRPTGAVMVCKLCGKVKL